MKEHGINTGSRTDFFDITDIVRNAAKEMGIKEGTVTVFVPHTTAGVTINENADPDVVADISAVLDKIIPWSAGYKHGEGNSAAHIKASLIGSSVRIPVDKGELRLGTWQGVYFCEFDGPRSRKVWITGN